MPGFEFLSIQSEIACLRPHGCRQIRLVGVRMSEIKKSELEKNESNHPGQPRMRLKQRRAKHRAKHPRDRVSFGEEALPKPEKITRVHKASPPKEHPKPSVSAAEEALVDVKQPLPNPPAPSRPKPSTSRLPATLRKCRKCGKVAPVHTVRVGDCHTSKYSKGDYGQGYSGNNGQGRLYNI